MTISMTWVGTLSASRGGGVRLVRDGIFTGKYKTLNPGKVVAACVPLGPGEEEFVNSNPMFELYGVSYTNNIKVIAALDNLVAINGAAAIDLTGQVTSENIGHQRIAGAGGMPEFAIGACFSKGGRSIEVLRSTARGDSVSRIVPTFPAGTTVTLTRHFVDYVVTEYGIASLFGKTARQRANELIAIAHPNFRQELRKEAQRLYWS